MLTLRGVGVEAVPQKMCYFNRAESVKKAPWCGREARDFWAEQEWNQHYWKMTVLLDQSMGEGRGGGMKLEGPLGSFECWARGERSYLCRGPARLWLIYAEVWSGKIYTVHASPWKWYGAVGGWTASSDQGAKGQVRQLLHPPERDCEPSSGFTNRTVCTFAQAGYLCFPPEAPAHIQRGKKQNKTKQGKGQK